MYKSILPIAIALASLAACGPTGPSKGFRTDVAAQMKSIETPLAQCYKDALWQHRGLRGTMILNFKIQAKTGQFMYARVARTEFGNVQLETCVVRQINTLKLTKPESTTIDIETFPLQFWPLN